MLSLRFLRQLIHSDPTHFISSNYCKFILCSIHTWNAYKCPCEVSVFTTFEQNQSNLNERYHLSCCVHDRLVYVIIFSRYWDTLSFLKRVLSPLSRVILLLLPITSPYLQWTLNLAKKFLTNDKITTSCRKKKHVTQALHQESNRQKKWSLKNYNADKFSKIHNCHPSQSSSVPPILYVLCCLYLVLIFWGDILMFHSIWWLFPMFKFWYISWHSSFLRRRLLLVFIRQWCRFINWAELLLSTIPPF